MLEEKKKKGNGKGKEKEKQKNNFHLSRVHPRYFWRNVMFSGVTIK